MAYTAADAGAMRVEPGDGLDQTRLTIPVAEELVPGTGLREVTVTLTSYHLRRLRYLCNTRLPHAPPPRQRTGAGVPERVAAVLRQQERPLPVQGGAPDVSLRGLETQRPRPDPVSELVLSEPGAPVVRGLTQDPAAVVLDLGPELAALVREFRVPEKTLDDQCGNVGKANEGGFQSLARQVKDALRGQVLALPVQDAERVVRYARRHAPNGLPALFHLVAPWLQKEMARVPLPCLPGLEGDDDGREE